MANDPRSLKTASKKVSHLGSAKSGVGEARAMHLTSVALVPLTIAFVWILVTLIHKDFTAVRAELGQPFPAIVMLLFVGAGIYHMKLGMQAIIDDYVHEHHLKDWALMANIFFSVAIGLACIYALLKVSFA
ncbi:succinate dehydrogenase, hydrophobic membrane anchor protein [Beijerinckia sp. L45]|uniref:succinate dehydrogenase, hydrophobic membrane anchor protein n=1 Tax=Beijerinckia sp. L45 TaxID=1641855 RepID=UPI00131AF0F2|nr:succinate dehydrogenase, hydrophobic membrane anchor protein [Beijerinckia sp. L45]